MKTVKLGLSLMLLCGFAQTSLSYIYTYTNLTGSVGGKGKELQIKMQLVGIGEPWYLLSQNPYKSKLKPSEELDPKFTAKNILAPGMTRQFRFVGFEKLPNGQPAPGDYTRKFGFCLAKQEYRMKGPDGAWTGWAEFEPKQLDSAQFDAVVKNSKGLAKGATDAAAAVLKVIPGPQTAAASTAIKNIDLGGLIDAIANLGKYSWCRERKVEIMDDGKDGVLFITK